MEEIHKIAQKYITETKDSNLQHNIIFHYVKSIAQIHQAKLDYETELLKNRIAKAKMELIIRKWKTLKKK